MQPFTPRKSKASPCLAANVGQIPAPSYDRLRPTKLQIKPPTEQHILRLLLSQWETNEGTDFKVDRTEANAIRIRGGRNDIRSLKKARPEETFTLLNSTYEYVLMAKNHMISKPSNRKLPRQIDKDTEVFCRYYQYNGHDTESCIALRKVVEHLISEGRLDQHLSTKPTPEQPANQQINRSVEELP